MKKSDVLEYYTKQCGGDPKKAMTALAKALGCTYQNAWQMPEDVPEGTAYKLQVITNGELKV
jgi:hypothetical protein